MSFAVGDSVYVKHCNTNGIIKEINGNYYIIELRINSQKTKSTCTAEELAMPVSSPEVEKNYFENKMNSTDYLSYLLEISQRKSSQNYNVESCYNSQFLEAVKQYRATGRPLTVLALGHDKGTKHTYCVGQDNDDDPVVDIICYQLVFSNSVV